MESPVERTEDEDKSQGEDSQSAKENGSGWEKEKERKVKRKSKRGRSSGSLTMKGDKITSFTTDRGVLYQPMDHVYIENNKPNQPYFICAIQEFSVIKRDTLVVKVKWYYRVSELPDSVFQHLVQDRYTQHVDSDHPLADPKVKSRELFCSEATDTYPVTALRGKCKVAHCNSLEAARTFVPAADTFYCILGYNPETKRLATTQGQIRVGSMYQARMPECRPTVSPGEMPERCEDREEFKWQPKGVIDGDLMMYLRAARSVAAFAGMCDGGSTEDGCQAASMDDTTINAMHVLHRFEYDTGKALQSLVKAPALRTIDKKWNEEDTKRFVKGLRVYGKNFFKIRKELLQTKETGELVEYYYYWKKTPAAAANRPHRRHRKHGVKRATTRSQRPASSEFLDVSSSGDSDNESEDSDGVAGFRCQNCLVTVSKDWSNAGKPNARLCTKCRIFFKKYGVDRPVDATGDSPYFQPVKDGDVSGPHSMLTRQNQTSTDPKEKKKGSNSVSSLDSPSSESKKSLIPSSPSAVSTCSNSSTDRNKRRSSVSPGKDKKRRHQGSDSEDKFSKRKLTGPSDSESVSDSSISGAEETPNDGDVETNQEELTSSSPPTTPSPLDTDYKQDGDKSTTPPLPIAVEATISDKLSQLPRPQPQHPSPGRPPLDSTPNLIPQLTVPPIPRQPLPNVPQIPSQGFVPLPPLPAFAFRPQGPLSDSLFPRSPFSEPLSSQKRSVEDNKENRVSASATVTDSGEDSKSDSNVHGGAKIKEEVVTPPTSPRPDIKQEKRDPGFMSGTCAPPQDAYRQQKEHFDNLTPKLEPGLHPASLGAGPPPGLNKPGQPGLGHPGSSHPSSTHPNPTHSSSGHPGAGHPGSGHPSSGHSSTIHPATGLPINSHPGSGPPHPSSQHPGSGHPGSGHPGSGHLSAGGLNSSSGHHPGPVHPSTGHPGSQHPSHVHASSGHPNAGHPSSGHPRDGHPSSGHPRDGHPNSGHPRDGHPSSGHPNSGHPRDGHPSAGHPGSLHPGSGHFSAGHPGPGHPRDGHPSSGHPRDGHPGSGHPSAGHPSVGHPSSAGHPGSGHPSSGMPGERLSGPGLPGSNVPLAGLASSGLPSSNTQPGVISVNPSINSTSQRLSEPTLTSQAEVKGHHPLSSGGGPFHPGPGGHFQGQPGHSQGRGPEGQGRGPESQGRGPEGEGQRSEPIEIEMEDEDSDREGGTLTPGPVPTPCNKEIHRSKTAIFIKMLNRGEHNSCSRCDLIFKPLQERKPREEAAKKQPHAPPTPAKEETKRKETPPPNPSADAHVISNLPPPHHQHQDRITPRSYPDTPALRQLSEYAKPHTLGQDPRGIPGGYLGYPFMDPIRMSAMYPPNSRERLELELERDKRERDARERELREQELRSMEMRDKLKAELEMKPPGLERLLPPGANPLDPHWLEIQRRYGPPQVLPGGSGSSPHIPGLYPPTSIATDLMARERERLERLGIPPGHPMLADPSMYTAAIMERLSAERLSAERLSAERQHAERLALQDPIIRLQMSGMPGAAAAAAAAAAQHAHTHAHTHSHTHLHLHNPNEIDPRDPRAGPPNPAAAAAAAAGLHYPLLPPHLLPPGADPMAGVNGSSQQPGGPGGSAPGSHPSLPVGLPPPSLLASREQELLQSDLYRRAYTDPALAQQLQAHHEALQRMVMDRERFGSGHLPPPH